MPPTPAHLCRLRPETMAGGAEEKMFSSFDKDEQPSQGGPTPIFVLVDVDGDPGRKSAASRPFAVQEWIYGSGT